MNAQQCQLTQYRLPDEATKVPDDTPGLYVFSLRFPSDYELGVAGDKPFDSLRVLRNIRARLDTYARVMASQTLTGQIADGKAVHLRCSYTVEAQSAALFVDPAILEGCFDKLPDSGMVLRVASVSRKAVEWSTPLYVGIAAAQSLQQRLTQHMNGQSAVLPRMHELGLSWYDMYFSCFPFTGVDRTVLARCEVMLQGIFKPTFCTK